VARTFIQSNIPDELYEAAVMDGASHTYFLFKIVYPLSKSLIAVISLFVAIGQWNNYFAALVYINDQKLYPLALVLRDILVLNQISTQELLDPDAQRSHQQMAEALKYALIVVASVPPLILYPLLQKHFVKGMMIGSLKG
jgi:ABC-type glycerol-3-phosphate transport system permease component